LEKTAPDARETLKTPVGMAGQKITGLWTFSVYQRCFSLPEEENDVKTSGEAARAK
jgi:hypothetical protein